jgi:hypothetical protein
MWDKSMLQQAGAFVYGFLPILMWIAVVGTLPSSISWASTPSRSAACSAFASASTGCSHSAILEEASCTLIPTPVIIPTFGLPTRVKATKPAEPTQFHPASTSRSDTWSISASGSGSGCIRRINGVPANGAIASRIARFCSSEITRGVVSRASSSLASSARAVASAKRRRRLVEPLRYRRSFLVHGTKSRR